MAVQEKDPKTGSGSANSGASKSPVKSVNDTGAPRRGVNRNRDEDTSTFSMLGIRSGLLHSVFVKVVLGLLIAIFAIGFAFTAVGPLGNAGGGGAPKTLGGGPDPVAKVGDQTIERKQFQTVLANQVAQNQQYGMSPPAEQALSTRQSALQNLTDEAARYEEAKKRNITASDTEIDAKIKEQIDNALKPGPGRSEASIRREIESQGKSVDDWKQEAMSKFDAKAREDLARQIVLDKLEKQIKDENKVTEDDYKRSMTRLKLRQIRISPKPPLPTEKDPKAAQEKSQADAKAKADKLAASLKNATLAQFVAAVKTNSDDVATKNKGGDLGDKMPTELPLSPAVKDAVVNSTGNIVGPVQDDYSKDFLIFYVEKRKLELPKDYAKKKKDDLKNFEDQKDNEAWSKFQDSLKKQYQPEIYDPALTAYKTQTEQVYTAQGDEQNRLRQQALDQYTDALTYASPSEATAIHYQMAQLYRDMRQPDKQLAELKTAIDNARDAKQARIEYARALRENNKKDDALKQLQELSKTLDENPAQPSPFGGGNPDDSIRYQIASEYEALGNKAEATKERSKIKPPQAQPGMNGMNLGGMGGMPQTITIPAKKK